MSLAAQWASDMDPIDHFSSTYSEAREKFLAAARARAAIVQTYVHPVCRGPSGEQLAVDVASIGEVDSLRVIMLVSGTHGVEGYAGSACQIAALESDLHAELAAHARLVLVHAINPFGFAHTRRTNEHNVDLNRNFVDFSAPLPTNSEYEQHAAVYIPSSGAWQDYLQASARLADAAADRGGYQFLKKALQPGQYRFPNGLYFGGTRPAWSNDVFLGICRQVFADARHAAVMDIHTGLGPSGIGEVIFMTQEAAAKYAPRFSAPVSCAGGAGSVSAPVKGPLIGAAHEQIRGATAVCCALEFGTVPIEENVQAKIFENWTHHFLSADDPRRRQSIRRMRDAYYCDESSWKRAVIKRFHEVVIELRRCVMDP